MSWKLLAGDVLDVLPSLETQAFDAVLCDPPYGLSFMGKRWDHGVPSTEVWREVLRVVKPGAHLLAFGGTRTFHRLACAIEDAGFEIRDCLSWLYGQGFPKSLDISKAIDKAARGFPQGTNRTDPSNPNAGKFKTQRTEGKRGESDKGQHFGAGPGQFMREQGSARDYSLTVDAARLWQGYGTALKPAWEPVIVAMKPLDGTFAENALAHRVAGLNIDGGGIGYDRDSDDPASNPLYRARNGYANGNSSDSGSSSFQIKDGSGERSPNYLGRWPANVLLDEEAAAMLDEQSGAQRDGVAVRSRSGGLTFGGSTAKPPMEDMGYSGSGGASRFFYVAKSSRSEREAGLDALDISDRKTPMAGRGQPGLKCRTCGKWKVSGSPCECAEPDFEQSAFERPTIRNSHPTVKPIKLAQYLATLILPPKRDTPRRLLVPFSGSGSEMIGALLAGWDEVVGIELEAEYVEIAEARLKNWITPSKRSTDTQSALFALE